MLREKQLVFLREYLVDMNGAEAARRAGYSMKHASGTASRILASPEAKRFVEAALEKRRQENGVTAERVRANLAAIAFGEAQGPAVGHKVRCLELLAKMLGLFESGGEMEPVTVVEDI